MTVSAPGDDTTNSRNPSTAKVTAARNRAARERANAA